MNSNSKSVETSPQVYARIGGALYLIIIVVGLFAEMFVRDKFIVSGDATTTANNIIASQLLWRFSVAGGILMLVCAVPLALILYVLLRPVSRDIALLAAFFNLVSIAIEAVIKLTLFEALFLLGNAEYLKSFESHQLHTLAYLSLKLHSYGYNISLVFFGFNCLFWGYLIFKSGYFPRFIGILLILCSFCYITNSFACFLAPKFANILFPAILVPAFIAELSLCLWLLIKGVNMPIWEKQVNETRYHEQKF
jgi:lipid-A-disaccharide synthase-like uncharacterized protein